MSKPTSYSSGRAVIRAITDAARLRSKETGEDTGTLIRHVYFDRFLCRIFADDQPPFALKGGMGMLARFPDARSTRDVDLEIADATLEDAVTELRALAARDIGDHLRFDYQGYEIAIAGAGQPELVACQVKFAIYAGASTQGVIFVDLAVHQRSPSGFEQVEPDFRLRLPKLDWTTYQVIAIEDQIADKLCAMRSVYGSGQPSTRVKDLVDLAVIARSGHPEAERLRSAIRLEAAARKLPEITQVQMPDDWDQRYAALVKATMRQKVWPDLPSARAAVEAMIHPVLDGTAYGNWDPERGSWQAA